MSSEAVPDAEAQFEGRSQPLQVVTFWTQGPINVSSIFSFFRHCARAGTHVLAGTTSYVRIVKVEEGNLGNSFIATVTCIVHELGSVASANPHLANLI